MRESVICCLVIALVLTLALPAAAVEGDQVMYVGGTAVTLRAGVIGHLDTVSETSLIFESSGTKLLIPYQDIVSFEYSTEVSHHLGVVPGIAVALLKKRERRHYFRISYRGTGDIPQAAVFEVPKRMPRTLQAVLRARAPQSCKPQKPFGLQPTKPDSIDHSANSTFEKSHPAAVDFVSSVPSV